MTTKVGTAVASHLSDAQHELAMGEAFQDKVRQRMNFVKLLIFRHTDMEEQISIETLNEYWEEIQQRYGKKEGVDS
jgi:hypothetical protein